MISKMGDVVVPIRFDLEVDGKFLKDAFCWNSSESDESLEEFAVGLCKDVKVPSTFVPVVVDAMRQQINEFRMVEEKAKARSLQEPERLEVIQIKLRSGTTSIEDQFVWDIFNRGHDDPERFAQVLCKDLDLDATKMKPLIAHKIREEVFNKKKDLFVQFHDIRSQGRDSLEASAGKRGGHGFGGAGASPSKLHVQRQYQKLLANKAGVKRSDEERTENGYETVVTHLTEAEAIALDDEDEKRAVQERQESVAKKIRTIQQENMYKKKHRQKHDKSLRMGMGHPAANTTAFGLPSHSLSSLPPAVRGTPHSGGQATGHVHPSHHLRLVSGMQHGGGVGGGYASATAAGMNMQQQAAYNHLQQTSSVSHSYSHALDPLSPPSSLDPIHMGLHMGHHVESHQMPLMGQHQQAYQAVGGGGVGVLHHYPGLDLAGQQQHTVVQSHQGTAAHYLGHLNAHQQRNQLHPQATAGPGGGVYAQPMYQSQHSHSAAAAGVYANNPTMYQTAQAQASSSSQHISGYATSHVNVNQPPSMGVLVGSAAPMGTSLGLVAGQPSNQQHMFHHHQQQHHQQQMGQHQQPPPPQGAFTFPPYMGQ
jgi:hypothetical protein